MILMPPMMLRSYPIPPSFVFPTMIAWLCVDQSLKMRCISAALVSLIQTIMAVNEGFPLSLHLGLPALRDHRGALPKSFPWQRKSAFYSQAEQIHGPHRQKPGIRLVSFCFAWHERSDPIH